MRSFRCPPGAKTDLRWHYAASGLSLLRRLLWIIKYLTLRMALLRFEARRRRFQRKNSHAKAELAIIAILRVPVSRG